jgi:hypothetical protein
MATVISTTPQPPSGDFLALYKLMHAERSSLAKEARKLEISAITAVAVLYAWLATNHIHGAPWYIGVPLVVLGAFRAGVLGGRVLFIKEYLKAMEARWLIQPNGPIGYETYFADNTQSRWYMHIRYTVGTIWLVLLLVTVIAPSFLQ